MLVLKLTQSISLVFSYFIRVKRTTHLKFCTLISYLESRRMEHDGWNIFKQGFKYHAIWSNKIG